MCRLPETVLAKSQLNQAGVALPRSFRDAVFSQAAGHLPSQLLIWFLRNGSSLKARTTGPMRKADRAQMDHERTNTS